MFTRLAFACLVLAIGVSATLVTISNTEPRRDTDGDILEVGDGCVNYESDTARYYIWGARYQPCAEPNNDCYCGSAGFQVCAYVGYPANGECCGWRNMTIAVYSSPDLVTWRKEGLNVLPIMQDYAVPYNAWNQGFMEVCGVYSRRTGFWNLWFLNAARPYYISTAVSRTVGGPYEIVNWNQGISGTADLYLYKNVTADTLLLQYNAGADVYVCTIKDDFLTPDSCEVGSQNNTFGYIEGGDVFQYGGSTFVMAGHGCCFCTCVFLGGQAALALPRHPFSLPPTLARPTPSPQVGEQRLRVAVGRWAAGPLHLPGRHCRAQPRWQCFYARAAVRYHARLHHHGLHPHVHWHPLWPSAGLSQEPRPAVLVPPPI